MRKSVDADLIKEVLSDYPDLIDDSFSVSDWLSDGNLCLEENRSLGLFYKDRPGWLVGHYFFQKDCRGKKAIDLAKRMIRHVFTETDCKVIIGLTPTSHLAALRLNRLLGFTEYETVQMSVETRLVMLTKTEWEQMNG